jgi:hypothetical protein
LHVALYWRAEEPPAGDWLVHLSLLDREGREQVALTAPPVAGYPTGQWQAGDVWRGQFDLPLPAKLPAGVYRLRVQAQPPDGAPPEAFLSKALRIAP